jgi:hypothetical protein
MYKVKGTIGLIFSFKKKVEMVLCTMCIKKRSGTRFQNYRFLSEKKRFGETSQGNSATPTLSYTVDNWVELFALVVSS